MNWIAGELTNLPVEWLRIETICPVNKERELLKVRVTGLTEGLTGGGYFDEFVLKKNLLDEKQTGAEKVFLPIDETTGEIELPVFGATVEAIVVAAHIVPENPITGNDSDYMTLKLVNKETGVVICTKTFVAGVDAASYEVCDFGPVNEAAGAINICQAVSFKKMDTGAGMTLPRCLLIVEWNLG